jgi:hypothetical protein
LRGIFPLAAYEETGFDRADTEEIKRFRRERAGDGDETAFRKYFRHNHTRTQSCALVLSGLLGFLDLKPFVVVTKLETIKAQAQPSDSHTLALRNRWLEDVALTTLTSEAGKAAVPGWGEMAPLKADLPHEQVSPSKMTERHRASGEA